MELTINNRLFKVQAVVMLFEPQITKVQFNEIVEGSVTEIIEISNGLISLNETQLTQLITDKITQHYAISI